MELEGKTLVIKRIHAHYTLHVDEDVDTAKLQRAYDAHADHCPVARSIRDAIDVTTSIEVVTPG